MRISCYHDQVFKVCHYYRRYSNEFRQDQNHIEIRNIKNDQKCLSIFRFR